MLIVFQRGRRCAQYAKVSVTQSHRGTRREDVGAASRVLLENVVLDRAAERVRGNALAFRCELVQEQQHRRRRIDGHRGGHPILGDAAHQQLHVLEGVDGDADLAHLAMCQGIVAVIAHLCRQVERDRQPALTGAQQVVESLVGLFGAPEPGVLAHRPEPRAVPLGADAAGEGELSRRRPAVTLLHVELLERQAGLGLGAETRIGAEVVAHGCVPASSSSGWQSSVSTPLAADGCINATNLPPAPRLGHVSRSCSPSAAKRSRLACTSSTP